MWGLWSRVRHWTQASPWGVVLAYIVVVGAAYGAIWSVIEPIGFPDTLAGLPAPLNTRLFYHAAASVLVASHLLLVALALSRRRTRPPNSAPDPAPVGPDEHRRLKEKVQELEAALRMKESLRFEPPAYYAGSDPTPYCAVCWEHSQRTIHLVKRSFIRGTDYWDCLVCQHRFGIIRS